MIRIRIEIIGDFVSLALNLRVTYIIRLVSYDSGVDALPICNKRMTFSLHFDTFYSFHDFVTLTEEY